MGRVGTLGAIGDPPAVPALIDRLVTFSPDGSEYYWSEAAENALWATHTPEALAAISTDVVAKRVGKARQISG